MQGVGRAVVRIGEAEVRRAEDIGRVFGRGDGRARARGRIVDRRDVDRERVGVGSRSAPPAAVPPSSRTWKLKLAYAAPFALAAGAKLSRPAPMSAAAEWRHQRARRNR